MINRIKLKSGRSPGSAASELNNTAVNVFVGPNNSGKSKILSEICKFCQSGIIDERSVLIDDIELEKPTVDQINAFIVKLSSTPSSNIPLPPDHIILKFKNNETLFNNQLIDVILDFSKDFGIPQFCLNFLNPLTLFLDGKSRINLINEQPGGDLLLPAYNSLSILFKDNNKRNQTREIIYNAISQHFTVDPTNLGYLRIRLSPTAPTDEREERGIHESAIAFHKNAVSIDQCSDGIKAFTGIVTELIAGDPKVILVDEPEAFLHPPLAYKLGFEISRLASSAGKRVFASTHSPQFLMGCIQSGIPINIVRLTYRGSVATSRILPNEQITKLMRNPLLRSTGLLNSLFYEFVIVTESDTDRAFYQEINERLLQYKPEHAIPNCLFINAQNKQTVQTLIAPLRNLGIPTAAIVDIDILKDGGQSWTSFLNCAEIPSAQIRGLSATRTELHEAMKASGKDMKRDGGLAILERSTKEAGENLLAQLAEYGLFPVPGGELESWLLHLNVGGHGPKWLIEIFEKMGENPHHSEYVKPEEGDVWEFFGEIRNWMLNQDRKGIPE